MRDREVEPPADEEAIEGSLMEPPEPVEAASVTPLDDAADDEFVAPVLVEFDNGVRVSLNRTPIAEGEIAFEGRSPGGSATLADIDVPAADAAATVIADSGVATYDAVVLDAFLSDKSVQFDLGIDPFTEGFSGYSSTDDIETLFQLIHLTMTAPRVDPLAVDRYRDDQLPYASDPSIDPGYAEFTALLDARYDDPRYLLPTVDSLSTVEADDIERVVRDRFGDASDWNFAFSGDLDVDDMVDLAERYLGTLPASGRVDPATLRRAAPAGRHRRRERHGWLGEPGERLVPVHRTGHDRPPRRRGGDDRAGDRDRPPHRRDPREARRVVLPVRHRRGGCRTDAERRDLPVDEHLVRAGRAGRGGDPRRAGRPARRMVPPRPSSTAPPRRSVSSWTSSPTSRSTTRC